MVNIIRAWTNACITLISRYSSFLRKRDSLSLIKYIFIRIFVLSWSRTYILRNFCLNETVKFSFFRYYKLRTSREEFFVFILTRSRPSDCWFSSTSLLIQRSWWLPPLSIFIKNRIWNRTIHRLQFTISVVSRVSICLVIFGYFLFGKKNKVAEKVEFI